MKQILQNLGTGETVLADVPSPGVRSGHLLVQSRCSLVSLGTERMLIDFARTGWMQKIRSQPEKVHQVISKIKTDGLFSTLNAVRSKLDQPIPLGYSNVGTVIESAVSGLLSGDRVVSNGPHAEMVLAPVNLCAKVPDEVSDEEASFAVVGSIALQGIRLLSPTLGERFVVVGLGLIGLLAVQLLRANGCSVLGVDLDSTKCAMARQFGAETVDLSKGADVLEAAKKFSDGRGVDGVLITASTKSNEPVHQAAEMCRKRGRIVLVGVVGLELRRSDFYEKELSFQVSCSYGPGRYDDNYEKLGLDYPIGFVRWTEQRNFEAFLRLVADKKLNIAPLISHRFPVENAVEAYNTEILGKALGIVIDYRSTEKSPADVVARTIKLPQASGEDRRKCGTIGTASVGLIGAGNFTSQVLLPGLVRTGARLNVIASASGVTASHLGRKFGFSRATTDALSLIDDPEVNTIVITTRHSSHADYVIRSLKAGKNVFVEKPLCVTRLELEKIRAVYDEVSARSGPPCLMVGFNRRFAPHTLKAKELLDSVKQPKTLIFTANAGHIPSTHWTQQIGEGGRIIGEACHYIDLLRFLIGAPIKRVSSVHLGAGMAETVASDNCAINLEFRDGSIGAIHYLANGHKSFPKERLEVFCGGKILQLDNFRELKGYGWSGFSNHKLWRQDKGHNAELASFIGAIESQSDGPIPISEIVEVTAASFDAAGLDK